MTGKIQIRAEKNPTMWAKIVNPLAFALATISMDMCYCFEPFKYLAVCF